jgi:cysteine desulfurase
VERYFDNAATTPLDPRVLAEMMPFLSIDFGNASSIHGFGMRARAAVDLARERVAQLVGAEDPAQVVFTSGATESNNWMLAAGWGQAFISPFEHSAVREPALARGYRLLENEGLQCQHPARADLISVMSVNNEIGARWNPLHFREATRKLHSDITQQVGKLPTFVEGLDYASFSAHKFYGPKGVGALYIADEPPPPLLLGGEQEESRRAGTLNVPGIVGMGAAAAIAIDELKQDMEKAAKLRAIVVEELTSTSEVRVNGGNDASPYILSISFRGVEGETLLVEADQAGYALSAGAACSSRSTEPSHVLTALGMTEEWLRGTIRISFGRFNTEVAAQGLAHLLKEAVDRMRSMRL